jgi:hypothetical protein
LHDALGEDDECRLVQHGAIVTPTAAQRRHIVSVMDTVETMTQR